MGSTQDSQRSLLSKVSGIIHTGLAGKGFSLSQGIMNFITPKFQAYGELESLINCSVPTTWLGQILMFCPNNINICFHFKNENVADVIRGSVCASLHPPPLPPQRQPLPCPVGIVCNSFSYCALKNSFVLHVLSLLKLGSGYHVALQPFLFLSLATYSPRWNSTLFIYLFVDWTPSKVADDLPSFFTKGAARQCWPLCLCVLGRVSCGSHPGVELQTRGE